MPDIVNRVKTGVSGLDELLGGGIPEESSVLLVGTPGAGKSVFALEFLVKGATDYNEPGIYLSFEETESSIIKNAKVFGWDLEKLIADKKLKVMKYDLYVFENLRDILISHIKQIGAKRVIIDSLSAINMYIRDPREVRKTMMDIKEILEENKCTALLVSEAPIDNIKKMSGVGVEEFVADGIIILYYDPLNTEHARSILVWKMRATAHCRKIHPFKIIGDKGIIVSPGEETSVNV